MIRKHSLKIKRANSSTFFNLNNEESEIKRVSITFAPRITNRIKNKFSEFNLQLVFKTENKLSSLLGSTKDSTPPAEKSGIYSITCGDCNMNYYGQTKRSIGKRFKEHSAYIRKNEGYKSAIAGHVLENGHFNVNVNNLRLLKQVNDERRLDAYESFFILNDENAINKDNGNTDSPLLCRI